MRRTVWRLWLLLSAGGTVGCQGGRLSAGEVFDSAIGASGRGDDAGAPPLVLDDGMAVSGPRPLAAVIEVLGCSGACLELETVVEGGHPPYSIRWEDGSVGAKRRACDAPDGGAFFVTVVDSSVGGQEFSMPAQTVSARLGESALGCAGDAAGDATVPPHDATTPAKADAPAPSSLVDGPVAPDSSSGLVDAAADSACILASGSYWQQTSGIPTSSCATLAPNGLNVGENGEALKPPGAPCTTSAECAEECCDCAPGSEEVIGLCECGTCAWNLCGRVVILDPTQGPITLCPR
jgi:hypothetical protein